MRWFSVQVSVCITALLLSAPMNAQIRSAVQKTAFRVLVDNLVKQSNLSMLSKLLERQRDRSAKVLSEEHLYDVGILQGACNILHGAKSVEKIRRDWQDFDGCWEGLERLQDHKKQDAALFLQSITGCEQLAFFNTMMDDKLTIAQLERAHSFYLQENSDKSRAMASWISLKIESKKLEKHLDAVRAVIKEKEEQEPAYLHYSQATNDHVEAYLLERDLARKKEQLEFLYNQGR